MKKKLIILTVVFLVFHVIFLRVYDKLLHKNGYVVTAVDTYRDIKKPLRFLFLGDSHIERGVDLSKIPDSYSIAYFGENNMMSYFKFKYCLEQGYRKPEYLVIDSDMMTYTKAFNKFIRHKGYYYSLMSFSDLRDIDSNVLATYYDYFKLTLFPYVEWQIVRMQPAKKREEKIYATPGEKAYHASIFVQKELLPGGKKEDFFYQPALGFLEKMIALCKENNIKLIYVRFPLTRQLLDEVECHVDSSFVRDLPAEDIIKSHHLPILNYERLLQNRSELFHDCHHLNDAGKAVFTKELKKGLDSLTNVY